MFFLHILILYHLLEEVIFTLYYLYTTTTLQKEYDGLRTTHADLKEQLAAVNEELKPMKDIRYWVSKVLSPEQTGEKQPEPKHSLKERLQYEQEQKKQKQVQKAPKQKKQDMEL